MSSTNQQNAQKSTGPKTPEGKAASSQNAVRHGLTAKFSLLAHEDAAAFNELLTRYRFELDPKTEHEWFLTDQIVQARWRIERAQRLEGLYLDSVALGEDPDLATPDGRILAAMSKKADPLVALQRATAAAERAYHKCQREIVQSRYAKDRHDLQQGNFMISIGAPPFPPDPIRSGLQNEPTPEQIKEWRKAQPNAFTFGVRQPVGPPVIYSPEQNEAA